MKNKNDFYVGYRIHRELYEDRIWKQMREDHLWKEPQCVVCKTTLNLQVDHIFEHKGNKDLFYDPNNLQTLCISCHGFKSSYEHIFVNTPTGKYTIILFNDDSIKKKYDDYYFFFKSKHKTLQRIVDEMLFGVIIKLGVKDLSVNEIWFLITMIIRRFKSKPKEIEINPSLDTPNVSTIRSWLKNKNY